MRKKENGDQGRVAKNAASRPNIRHFGLITARIFDADRRVELSFSPRYKEPISDQVRDRCLTWALDSLAELQERGYIFNTPGTVPSD